jgi:hypothetical protein
MAFACSGGCTFDDKYANALAAGVAAMVIVNEEIGLFALPSTGRFVLPATPAGDTTTAVAAAPYIPVGMVSRDAGVWLRKLLADYSAAGPLIVSPMQYNAMVSRHWEEIEKYLDHLVCALQPVLVLGDMPLWGSGGGAGKFGEGL